MNDRPSRLRAARWAAPLITLLAAITAGNLFGVQLVVLTLAAAALLLVIWLLWSSVQALAGESELTFEEAFSLGTRSAEEEQKRAVLRALKDLEYERSVGKIGEDDYHEYAARYRAEAKRLIQTLDESLAEGRKHVERELERRLAKSKLPRSMKQANGTERSAEEESRADGADATAVTIGEEIAEETVEINRPALPQCPDCQTKNELDARFCKACGKPLATPAEDNP